MLKYKIDFFPGDWVGDMYVVKDKTTDRVIVRYSLFEILDRLFYELTQRVKD